MPIDEAQLSGRSKVGRPELQKKPSKGVRRFQAIDPNTSLPLDPVFHAATQAEIEEAGRLAARGFRSYAALPGPKRARFLRRIAKGLENRRDALVDRAGRETGLPAGRLQSELGRTAKQLVMFAELVEQNTWLDARIDQGDPSRMPVPKPDVRSLRRPLGPVAVFGASNFPLAFSVAGGDTASALAAGCPVIAKAHPSHPGTSELAGLAIIEAADELDLPPGVFSLLFDDGHEVGQKLVQLPEVKAVGFTGSRSGGEALMRLASERPEPIPVYAEMGSINPVFVLPSAARERSREIADELHESFTLGVGQFCTKPGVALVPSRAEGNALVNHLAERTRRTPQGVMLNEHICKNYNRSLDALKSAGAQPLAHGQNGDGKTPGVAALWEVEVADVLREPKLLAEVFGPSTLIVRYHTDDELLTFTQEMEGQLTATLIAQPQELQRYQDLIEVLADRAGRVIVNQFPTGVEVGPAMIHGGPFPATSDGRGTSVGTRAIERFTRYVAYQNFPQALLPEVLRDP